MKVRSLLTLTEVETMSADLDRRLEGIGIASQPEVVLRLLQMTSDAGAQIQDFARVMRADHAITGRVLKLANSALFAQRVPVTTLERACLVLGLERLRCLALGFHLSRAAVCGVARDVSREQWGQSVLRACMASELARVVAPANVPEAFLIGLMMDSGVPLMHRLIGDQYLELLRDQPAPGRLFRLESETLPFTHVDVVVSMAKRWKFPEVLSKPLAWHHTKPTDAASVDALGRLHRVAYVVGLIHLRGASPSTIEAATPGVETGARILGLTERDVQGIVTRCTKEYGVTVTMFSDVAASLGDGEDLIDLVQRSLVSAVDMQIEESIAREDSQAPRRLTLAGQTIEVEIAADGWIVAYLYDSRGQRLLSHRVAPGNLTATELSDGLGLLVESPEDTIKLAEYVRRLAA